MKRPYRAPRTAPLIAALIAAVAAATLALCVATFLRSYRAAAVENARTNSAQAVSQVAGTVGNYVQTLDETIVDVMEELYMPESDRDAYLDAWNAGRWTIRRARRSCRTSLSTWPLRRPILAATSRRPMWNPFLRATTPGWSPSCGRYPTAPAPAGWRWM